MDDLGTHLTLTPKSGTKKLGTLRVFRVNSCAVGGGTK